MPHFTANLHLRSDDDMSPNTTSPSTSPAVQSPALFPSHTHRGICLPSTPAPPNPSPGRRRRCGSSTGCLWCACGWCRGAAAAGCSRDPSSLQQRSEVQEYASGRMWQIFTARAADRSTYNSFWSANCQLLSQGAFSTKHELRFPSPFCTHPRS